MIDLNAHIIHSVVDEGVACSQAVGEMAWRVQTVTSAARKLAVPIKFQNVVT